DRTRTSGRCYRVPGRTAPPTVSACCTDEESRAGCGSGNKNFGLPDAAGIGGNEHLEHAVSGTELDVAAAIAAERAFGGRFLERLGQSFCVFRSRADMTEHIGSEILDERRGCSLTGKLEREEEVV